MSFNYHIGGSLPSEAPTYVVRQADRDLFDGLSESQFCYVLNSRQMGKSSLKVQTAKRLEADGVSCATVDLTQLGSQHISPDQWYVGICRNLLNSFSLKQHCNLRDWWKERDYLSTVNRFSEFIETVLLLNTTNRLVIFVDEIDTVLGLEFSFDDFFTVIRDCYNRRSENKEYYRLTFCLLGVATPSKLIRDKSRTPFNIGRAIQLPGFQLSEARPLLAGIEKCSEDPERVLHEILDWTGGQPFLTQKLCYIISESNSKIEHGKEKEYISDLVRKKIIHSWEYQDEPEHLRTIASRLLRNEKRKGKMLGLYQQILEERTVEADGRPEKLEIQLTGLVYEDKGFLKVYNRIYRAVFCRQWVEEVLQNLRPYAESLSTWIASSQQDSSRLLHGQALNDALSWAKGKQLSEIDDQFLRASQLFSQTKTQEALDAQTKANRLLERTNKMAKRRLALATGVFLSTIAMSATIGIQTRGRMAKAEQSYRETSLRLEESESKASEAIARENEATAAAVAVKEGLATLQQNLRDANQELRVREQALKSAQEDKARTEAQIAVNRERLDAAQLKLDSAQASLLQAVSNQKQAESLFEIAKRRLATVESEKTQFEAERARAEQKAKDATVDAQEAQDRMISAQAELGEAQEALQESTVALSQASNIFRRLIGSVENETEIALSSDDILALSRSYEEFRNSTKNIIGSNLEEAQNLIGLGRAASSKGDYRQAILSFQRALELFNEDKNSRGEITALSDLANTYRALDTYELALENYRDALDIASQENEPQVASLISIYIGDTYREIGNYQEAISAYNQSLRNSGNSFTSSLSLANLGSVYAQLGRADLSISAYQRALESTRMTNNVALEANVLRELGVVYTGLGELEKAVELLEEAVELYRLIGDSSSEAQAMRDLNNAR